MLRFICCDRWLVLVRLCTLLLVFLLPGSADSAGRPNIEVVSQLKASWSSSVAFSPDGGRIATLQGHTVSLWDVTSGTLLRTIDGQSGSLFSIAFSPEGDCLATGGAIIKLWDPATGRLILRLDYSTLKNRTGEAKQLSFSPDGRFIVASISGDVVIWERRTGKVARTFENKGEHPKFSPDGRFLLTARGGLSLWNASSGEALRTIGHKSTTPYALSADGRNVIAPAWSDSNRLSLHITDVASGNLVRTIDTAKGSEFAKADPFSSPSFSEFSASQGGIAAVAYSPDGRLIAVSAWENNGRKERYVVKFWDAGTGELRRALAPQTRSIDSLAFSPDGQRLATSGPMLKVWDVATGSLLREFDAKAVSVSGVRYSPDGRQIVTSGSDGELHFWDTSSGRSLRSLKGAFGVFEYSSDSLWIASGGEDRTVKLWDAATGELLKVIHGHDDAITAVAFSPDRRRLASGAGRTIKIWDTLTGELLSSFGGGRNSVKSLSFSADGTQIASGTWDGIKLWNVQTGTHLRTFSEGALVSQIAFSPDGRTLASAESVYEGPGRQIYRAGLWDTSTGQLIRALEGHSDIVSAIAFSMDGQNIVSGGHDRLVKIWAVASGKLLHSFEGHSDSINSVAFSPEGRSVASTSGASRMIWSLDKGEQSLALFASSEGDWLALTPYGFFDFAGKSEKLLRLVRGYSMTSLEQTYRSLYNPDLLRELLAGDPNGEVKRAASVINLEKVIESGPAPTVEIATPEAGKAVTTDIVTATARITDKGKGIGRIEWRVNGVTAAVTSAAPGSGPDYVLSQQLALDRGDNTIELVAYNASNLLASLPARTTISASPPEGEKPRLHVLAIGINAYVDKGSIAPSTKTKSVFPPLSLAVMDAAALAAALRQAGAQQYAEVKVTEALDSGATASGLQQTIERMAQEIHTRDTFVLFAAAHGTSHNGRFYLIPQDYDGGMDPAALQERAIGQDRLQDWVANKIKAKKVLILLDTCESGALVGGTSRSRTEVPASEAALGRLHEATGRPVLTAAAEGKPAFEGFEGHGVFTWALLDALKNGDRNSNGTIELSELVTHVQDQVPKIAAMLNGSGRAAIVARGTSSDRQSARFGSRGEDFSLVQRLQ